MAEDNEITNTSIEQKQKFLDISGQQTKVNRELSASYANQIIEMQKLVEAGTEQKDNLDALLALKDKHVKKMAEEGAAYKKVQAEITAINKKMSEMEDVGKTAAKNLRDLSRAFGVPKNFEKSLTGSIIKLASLNKESKEGQKALGKFRDEMKEGFSAGNISMSIMGAAMTAMQDAAMFLFKNLKDVAIEFDEMRASINKSILSAEAYVDIAKQTSIENMRLGVTADVAGEATSAIAKNMDLASDTNKVFAKQLGETVSKMSVLGADTSQTTKVLSFFQRGLKQTAAQTNQMALRVQKLASGLKIGLGEAFDQLNTALPTLSAHGDGMTEIFEDLATQARATGVSMQTLLGVAGKFDQFQSGAQSVAALNAMLGGAYLNSTELVRMSENERLKTIIATVQAQKGAFKDMDRYEKKYIANAVGITDMAEANKLFGMSVNEYDGYAAQVDKAKASQEALDKATAKAIPVLKSLQLAVAEFVADYGDLIQDVLEGTLDLAKSFLKWRDEGADMWSKWGLTVVAVLSGVTLFFGYLLVKVSALTSAMLLLAPATASVAGSLAAVAAAGGGAALAGGAGAAAGGGAAVAAGGATILPILAGIALVAAAAYGAYQLFEGNDRSTPTTAQAQKGNQGDFVIDNATLNLTFSAEETVRISKTLTSVGLKANGMT